MGFLASASASVVYPSCIHAPKQHTYLERWQVQKLRSALEAGRKSIEIKVLCKETKLDRHLVLEWLKSAGSIGGSDSFKATEHQLEGRHLQSEQTSNATPVLPQEPSTHNRGTNYAKPARRFSRAAEDTLELVFERYRRPPENIILDIVDIHKLPKRQVVDWFAERRKFARGEGRKPSRVRTAVIARDRK